MVWAGGDARTRTAARLVSMGKSRAFASSPASPDPEFLGYHDGPMVPYYHRGIVPYVTRVSSHARGRPPPRNRTAATIVRTTKSRRTIPWETTNGAWGARRASALIPGLLPRNVVPTSATDAILARHR